MKEASFCTSVVGVLLSLLGSKFCEVRGRLLTIISFLFFVDVTVHRCPEVVSIQTVLADQMVVFHPSLHSAIAVLAVLSNDLLLKGLY